MASNEENIALQRAVPERSGGRRKVVVHARYFISKHASKISKQADEHEQLLNQITYCLGVFCFGTVCYVMGSRPHDIPYLYCLFFLCIAPLRWIYYRVRKWHYYLLDFCYYANVIFMVMLLIFPNNEKLFMVCFSFSEGPLAWALIVWRCSLVFSSIDKIISVIIHLLPGTVFFIIRWWDPITYPHHAMEATGPWPAWPVVQDDRALWTWLFLVPLVAYSVWQALYILIVNVLRKQRLLSDPEVMTSFRELSRKAARANNIWWHLSGLLGDHNRVVMYAAIQAAFTVLTMALTVPLFKSYRLHILFELFKATIAVWNGGKWLFDVMPRQMEKKKAKGGAGCAKSEALGNPTTESSYVSTKTVAETSVVCSLCRQLSSSDSDVEFHFKEVIEQATKDIRQASTCDIRQQASTCDTAAASFHPHMKALDAISCAS